MDETIKIPKLSVSLSKQLEAVEAILGPPYQDLESMFDIHACEYVTRDQTLNESTSSFSSSKLVSKEAVEAIWAPPSMFDIHTRESVTRDQNIFAPPLPKVERFLSLGAKCSYAAATLPFFVIWDIMGRPSRNELREGCYVPVKRDGTIDALPLHKANRLALSSKDLENSMCRRKGFKRVVLDSLVNITPKSRGFLLFLCGGVPKYVPKGNIPQIQSSILSIEEAFFAFFPEMIHITLLMVCYTIAWILILSLRPAGVQLFLVLLLITVPVSYLPELVPNASGQHVICGSLKLPLMFFKILGAFGLSLICSLFAFLVVYLNWRFIYNETPKRVEDSKVKVEVEGEVEVQVDIDLNL